MKFKNILIAAFVLIIVVVVGYLIPSKKEAPLTNTDENVENTNPPVFVWKYEKDDSLNLDGIPNNNVFLEVKYSNGRVETKLIDTTPGSCNDLSDADKDSVPNSTNIQCYSAGLGYKFKITKGEESYLVKRKTFEEGLPDYNPPASEYEVVSEFPLN